MLNKLREGFELLLKFGNYGALQVAFRLSGAFALVLIVTSLFVEAETLLERLFRVLMSASLIFVPILWILSLKLPFKRFWASYIIFCSALFLSVLFVNALYSYGRMEMPRTISATASDLLSFFVYSFPFCAFFSVFGFLNRRT